MPRNDEGEFELILGNKQLLSVFFIVVVLLGVFFAMGYIVGRNTSPSAQTEVAAAGRSGGPGSPLIVEPPGRETPAPSKGTQASAPPAKPAQSTPPPKTAEAKPPKPVETKPTPPPVTTETSPPASGATYLQVSAVKKPDADLLVEVLGKKGIRAITAPVPGQDLARVLVGPLSGPEEIAKMRENLEASGFKPIVRRY